ncbi:hypothetical protein ACFSYD_12180 [Paracoccus aerius]
MSCDPTAALRNADSAVNSAMMKPPRQGGQHRLRPVGPGGGRPGDQGQAHGHEGQPRRPRRQRKHRKRPHQQKVGSHREARSGPELVRDRRQQGASGQDAADPGASGGMR